MSERLNTALGAKLVEVRKSRGFTQEQLAYASGIDRSYVGKIERGQVNLTIKKLYILAECLGCHPCELLPDIDLPRPTALPG
ncbi:helix-turn-helix domain-containing protein [Marinobacter nauticus]|uniref:helix-turn-helix domain-containing protein n=1 Tax=Marinobacter nauticus TaxID=2743 RepID=UPI001C9A1D99|nr:helix-turn-helix transcriptional regulator [Marinobacter nauticus]MBY5938096.1 helix-turn-helix transcriptional regulator [Marinobacter nauticus]MBY5955325.1 helix-turn-helix transcriptional regulator [Marinobacter nauticus]MBY6009116.1 helix-turn-helix transcriptional regulator [Marinobacter nauticus]